MYAGAVVDDEVGFFGDLLVVGVVETEARLLKISEDDLKITLGDPLILPKAVCCARLSNAF
jgi:hypothetical protein